MDSTNVETVAGKLRKCKDRRIAIVACYLGAMMVGLA
jgi:hypothetical protein